MHEPKTNPTWVLISLPMNWLLTRTDPSTPEGWKKYASLPMVLFLMLVLPLRILSLLFLLMVGLQH